MKCDKSLVLVSLFLLVIMIVPGFAQAQYPCQIISDKEMPVCSETPVTLSVHDNPLYRFKWTPGDFITNSITVKPIVSTTYHVYVTDTMGFDICEDSFTVEVRPRFQTSFHQLKLTCSNSESELGQTAQLLVTASGSEGPFIYEWENVPYNQQTGIDNAIATGLKAYTKYRVKITDQSCGCVQYDSCYTRGFPAPVILILCNPSDTVPMQNSDVSFSFENLSADSIPVVDFFWSLPDGQITTNMTPVFTFTQPNDYAVSLTVTDNCGCDTTYTKQVKVVPFALNENSSISVDISPNPTNGNVIIKAENLFKISIFNMYGQLIYEDVSDSIIYGYDFSRHDAGIYILRIKTSKGMATKRVVVTK